MRGSRFTLLTTLFAFCGWGLFSCNDQQKASGDLAISIQSTSPACKASIRGLYLVNDHVGWASGSGGTFLRMTDGEHWEADTVNGFTHLDFRDVHAFDDKTALLMASGSEGRIFRTEDGGESWAEVYTRLDSGIFLDGMDFYKNVGYCYGDPIDGKFVLIRSTDFGKTWMEVPQEHLPDALPNEVGFAASGTGIIMDEQDVRLVTGGDSSRMLWWIADQEVWIDCGSTLSQGDGCGVFSFCKMDSGKLMMVGGCYLDSTDATSNSAIADYSGYLSDTYLNSSLLVRFILEQPPRGYRSCVAYATKDRLLVTCGRTGAEYSKDNGVNWIPFTDDGYFTCALAGSNGWMMGRGGKMAKLSW